MADWTNLPNERFEPGAPARGVDARRLRDNPIAIAEGAAGAPRIQTDGINNGAVTNAKLADNAVTNPKVAAGSLGAEKFQTGTDERDWVLARCAAASAGAVGTYAMLFNDSGGAMAPGDTRAGSNLRYSNASATITGTGVSGTWRCMGRVAATGTDDPDRVSVFLRIS